jgi:hypothetical protein
LKLFANLQMNFTLFACTPDSSPIRARWMQEQAGFSPGFDGPVRTSRNVRFEDSGSVAAEPSSYPIFYRFRECLCNGAGEQRETRRLQRASFFRANQRANSINAEMHEKLLLGATFFAFGRKVPPTD